jgi:HAD superfamily hydrolase (TIGR01509 family)
MPTKKHLIIFDFDGVILDVKDVHFDCLNQAIEEVAGKSYVISLSDHRSIFDGKKTRDKLQILCDRGMRKDYCDKIWNRKQELTIQAFQNIKRDDRLTELFHDLRMRNFSLACCSNSISPTLALALNKCGVSGYLDLIIANDMVKNAKPHPEMYWVAMSELGALPENTLIVEDSPTGLLAAKRSGARVLRVANSKDYDLNKILNAMGVEPSKPKWANKNMNVVIPCAGQGSRFKDKGYTFPKPLIEVNGKPMVQLVVESLGVEANWHFIVRQEHIEQYNIDTVLNVITGGCKVKGLDGVTDGAARTVLTVSEWIDNDSPLLIANSDQFVEYDSLEFFYKMQEGDFDAGILTFNANHPKWSYAKVENGLVTEVAEKRVISDHATVGVYYYKSGADFCKYARQMIDKNIRVNNEFYVAPVFNEYIGDGKRVAIYDVDKMHGLGTPEDLETFLRNEADKS